MKKFLILAFACLSACLVHAQTPETITFPKGPYKATSGTTEVPCLNNAGTFVLGQKGVNTQSNDLTLDTIWLCRNDSIFINHNNDFILSGDPNPLTPPGIGYAFYTCPPTVAGTTLNAIIGSPAIPPTPPNNPGSPGNPGDPCLLTTPTDPILATSGNPNGDTWFFNSGFLQTNFNMGLPILLHFAPITFDDAINNGYETTVQGGPPGDCVNVRIDQEFEVVYLNAVTADGITPSFGGNTCLGRFKLGGGYPEWDATALYDVKVYLKGNPSVKALINTPINQLSNNVSVVFSVPVSGTYVIEIEDGKSCGFRGEIDMTACVNSDNVGFVLPTITGGPGETVCVPITTQNFSNIQGFSISMQWDPAVLQLQLPNFIQNINGDLTDFVPSSGTETSLVGQGYLGILHSGALPATLTPAEVLMEVCFTVLAQTNAVCTPLTFINIPSSVNSFNGAGDPLAVEAVNGTFCSVFNPLIIDIDTIPPGCNDILFDYTISVTGEEPPYEIQYRRVIPAGPTGLISPLNAGTAGAMNDLTPGTYQIIVTPQNGADIANADTLTLVVVQPEQLGAALNLTQLPKCSGEASGEVSVTVFEGTTAITNLTGYTLSWAPSTVPSPNGPVQSNVAAGVYSVTVTQIATGCTAVASGTLGNPPQLLNKIPVITPASCTGLANGCFTFELQGGTPFFGGQYMYDVFYLTEGGDTINSGNFTGVTYNSGCDEVAGTYLIVSTDANGCTFSYDLIVPTLRKIELTQNTALSLSPKCNGGMDGQLGVSIIETPATPAGNFFFTWVPGGTIVSTPLNSTASGLKAGCYFVAAVDVNGCNDTLTVCLTEPPVFKATPITVNNPTCISTSAGSISVIGQGGTGAPNTFTYVWSLPPNIGSSISNLPAGTYTVTISDANLCTAVFDTTLALPPPPPINNITQVDVRCGNDGSLTAIAPTATSFMWTSTTGNTIASPNQATINNLMGGTYVIKVTDANSCTNTDTITLVGVMPLSIIDTTLENPTCFGYLDGRISIGVEGGNPNYTFLWSVSPPSTINPISGLKAGTYTVTITDSKMCTFVDDFTLVEPPQIQIIPTTKSTSCFGICDGEATIQANYPPNNNFNFIWSVAGSTDSLRTDLCAGTFKVTVTETGTSQCFVIQDVTIGTPPMIIASTESSVDSVSCNGLSDGQISVSGEGGNGGPFTYNWQHNGSTNSLQSNLMANTPYAVTITDKNGCTGTASFEVEEPGAIVITKSPSGSQELACAGDDNGAIALDVQGGNAVPNGGPGQYTYIWSDGSNQIGTTNPLEMLSAGAYLVTVSDYKSCTGTTSITLNDPPFVVGSYKLGDPLKCFGDETTISIVAITGGSGGPYSYTLDYGVPLSPTLASSISGGEHFITYIDNKNCEVTESVMVDEPDQITVTFDSLLIEIQLGETRKLTPKLLPLGISQNIASFEWSPAEFLIDPTEFEATMYTFESGTLMLTVVDSFGCTGKGSFMVEVDLNRNIYIPNVFIPNDNINYLFGVGGGIGVEKVNYMRVYDRWGELMYDRNNFLPEQTEIFNNGWDGRHNGKFVNPGVYVYAIEVLFVDGKKLLYRGDVTVVR